MIFNLNHWISNWGLPRMIEGNKLTVRHIRGPGFRPRLPPASRRGSNNASIPKPNHLFNGIRNHKKSRPKDEATRLSHYYGFYLIITRLTIPPGDWIKYLPAGNCSAFPCLSSSPRKISLPLLSFISTSASFRLLMNISPSLGLG